MAAPITFYTDPAVNGFKKSNLYYNTNPMIKYQDPTYLGFKLFFLFDQPESGLLSDQPLQNTACGYLQRIGDTIRRDYLISFVKLLKRINSETPWFFQSIDGLDEAWKHMYQEKDFKPILTDRKITINCLDESIDLRMTALMDLYRKACFDWEYRREVVPLNLRRFKVAVYCYEARSINRSGTPKRWSEYQATDALGLPDKDQLAIKNKKQPDKDELDKFLGVDPSTYSNDYNKDFVNPNISRIMLNFEYCEFLPDESNTILASLSNKELTLKAQKIAFKYGNVKESNMYRFHHNKMVADFWDTTFDSLALDTPSTLPSGSDSRLKDLEATKQSFSSLAERYRAKLEAELERALAQYKIPKLGKLDDALGSEDGNIYGLSPLEKQIEKLPQALKDAARRAVAEALSAAAPARQFFLGNVWGFSGAQAAQVLRTGSVAAALQVGLQEVGKNASKKNATEDASVRVGKANQITNNVPGSLNNQSIDSDKRIDTYGQGSASLTNKTKDGNFGKAKFFDDFIPSLGNDKSPGSSDQGSSPENPSLSNNTTDSTGSIAKFGEGSISLGNDDGPDSTDQGSANGNVSLSNGDTDF
jgi:hypothetical protein